MSFEDFLENPTFPTMLQFETNTLCNANCLMCPHDKMKRRGTAKWSLITKIIREAVPTAETVCPFLMQEPFLEPRLLQILANIKQRNPKCETALYSNFSKVPTNTIRKIIDYELLDILHISFYGPTEALYKKWQPPLNRTATIKNIKKTFLYRQRKKATKPKMYLQVLSVPELIEAAKGYVPILPYVDKIVNVRFDTFHDDIPDYGGDQTKYFAAPPQPRTPCQRLWSAMSIHFDGNVVPCCIDYDDMNVLGNVSKDSLQDVWSNMNFRKFRLLHLQGRWNEIPMCRNCTAYKYEFNKDWVEYWQNQKKPLIKVC